MQRSPRSHPRPHHAARSSPSMSTHPHHPQQGPSPGYPYQSAHPSMAHALPHYQHTSLPPLPQQSQAHPHHPPPPVQQQHGPPPPVHSSSRGPPPVPTHANGPPAQQHPLAPPPSSTQSGHAPPAPLARLAPPTVPAPVLNGGSANGNNLLQGPPPGQRLPQAGQGVESATVAQILRDGEGGLREEIAERKPLNPILERLAKETEMTWVAAGSTAEALGNVDRAAQCYEAALKHNPYSVEALGPVATLYRRKEDFRKAAEYFSRLLSVKQNDPNSGETWGALGHCYLMLDDLQKAYTSYQQALYSMSTPKHEPKLWYGIGILYDRYGSLEHAEEAFSLVIKMDKDFEKANEIYFRLGIIYKQQQKHESSLGCFRYILRNPPPPLTEIDIWFQVGHVYEQMGNCDSAKEAYERVLADNPTHAKVLQQLGGLYCRANASFYDPEEAVDILTRSLETDSQDAVSWYLLGRAYMTMQNYSKAYESYQQAVYRDGKNPAFWCSIGVLYYAISQYRDSLDAYSRAIRINPYIPEVWFNLGALYESCNDQMTDAIDAYQRAVQLDENNVHVQRRLTEIRQCQQTGRPLGRPPSPKDMSAAAASWHINQGIGGPPEQHFGGPSGPPGLMQVPGTSPSMTAIAPPGRPQSSQGIHNGRPNTATIRPGSPGIHRNAPSYAGPVIQERSLSGGHGALAPMDVERSPRSGRVTSGHTSGTAHHNLPHIAQVYDRRPSRGPSPGPNQGTVPHPAGFRGGDPVGGRRLIPAPGPESQSRRSPTLARGAAPTFLDERGPAHPHSYASHHPPPQNTAPVAPHHTAYNQRGLTGHEDVSLRSADRQAWKATPVLERPGRSPPHSAYAQPPMTKDYTSGYSPPVPQHQSPYDPRHQSSGAPHSRAALPPPPRGRFASDQKMDSPIPPSGWSERGYSSHMPPGEERRPASQNGPPPSHHHTVPRWDPKHEGPSPHRAKAPPQGSVSGRPSDEEDRRQAYAQSGLPAQTSLGAQPSRVSPTPSIAASDGSTGGGTRKGRSKVRDEDYAPSSAGGKKRKAPAKVPEGAPKEKKDKKKPAPPKVRGKKGSSNAADMAPTTSPRGPPQPPTFGPPIVSQTPLTQSGPSTLQHRRVDEDYDVEEDEEGASSLLHLAGQGSYQIPPRKLASALSEKASMASLKRPSRGSPNNASGPNDTCGASASAPHSAASAPSPPRTASGPGGLSNQASRSPVDASTDGPHPGSRNAANNSERKVSLEAVTSNGNKWSRPRERQSNGGYTAPQPTAKSPNNSKLDSSGLSSASASCPHDEPNGGDVGSGPEGRNGDAPRSGRLSVGRERSEDRDSMSAEGQNRTPEPRSDGILTAADASRNNVVAVQDDEDQEEDQMEE